MSTAIQRIDVKTFTSEDQEVNETICFYIEIHPTYVRRVCQLYAEDEDEDTGIKEERFFNQDYIVKKCNIAGILKYYYNKVGCYIVDIEVMSESFSLAFRFKTEEEANTFHQQILDWYVND